MPKFSAKLEFDSCRGVYYKGKHTYVGGVWCQHWIDIYDYDRPLVVEVGRVRGRLQWIILP